MREDAVRMSIRGQERLNRGRHMMRTRHSEGGEREAWPRRCLREDKLPEATRFPTTRMCAELCLGALRWNSMFVWAGRRSSLSRGDRRDRRGNPAAQADSGIRSVVDCVCFYLMI